MNSLFTNVKSKTVIISKHWECCEGLVCCATADWNLILTLLRLPCHHFHNGACLINGIWLRRRLPKSEILGMFVFVLIRIYTITYLRLTCYVFINKSTSYNFLIWNNIFCYFLHSNGVIFHQNGHVQTFKHSVVSGD